MEELSHDFLTLIVIYLLDFDWLVATSSSQNTTKLITIREEGEGEGVMQAN